MKKIFVCLVTVMLLFTGNSFIARAEDGDDSQLSLGFEMDTYYATITIDVKEDSLLELVSDDDLYRVVFRVTLEDVSGNSLASYETRYHFIVATDYLNYYLQENGFIDQARFRITALLDGKQLATGVTDYVECRDFYPEQEELLIGPDVNLFDVNAVFFKATASYREGNYSYEVHRYYDEYVLYADYYDSLGYHDIERNISEKQYQEIIDIISRGKLIRKYVMDPELEILDGGSEEVEISWDGMSALQRNCYRLQLWPQDMVILRDTMQKMVTARNTLKIIAVITGCIVGVGVALISIRRNKNKR